MNTSELAATSKRDGYATESLCKAVAYYAGYDVEHTDPHQKHDARFIDPISRQEWKVQIKKGRLSKGNKGSFATVANKARYDPTSGRKVHEKIHYTSTQIDAFLTWIPETGTFHLIPFHIADNHSKGRFYFSIDDFLFGNITCKVKESNKKRVFAEQESRKTPNIFDLAD
jgi:hypothetical protein